MLINTDLSTDAALAGRQNLRPEAGSTASQSSSKAANNPAGSQIDPFLQRLAGAPAATQDDAQEIQDEQAAGAATEAARQSILRQPDTALAAQANSLSQNVLNLLQPAD